MTAPSDSVLPTSRHGWVELLRRLGVRPSKGLGQNFLFERGICERLARAAEIEYSDIVVEIGPGLGILTEELLHHARRVIAVELDARLARHLRQAFSHHDRLQVIEQDALNLDLERYVPPDAPFVVAANLPYSSATAIIRNLVEHRRRPRRLVVMVQREVAERIVAEPPNMTILTVATQFYTNPRIAFIVPPSVFLPPPKVDSAVLILDVRKESPLPRGLGSRFFRIVNAGFRQRRKQLANTLAAELGLPKSDVVAWLTSNDITPDRRAQTLSLDDWVALTINIPSNLAPVIDVR